MKKWINLTYRYPLTLATKEAIYAYKFERWRYDVGDKLGFLEATFDFALNRPELKDDFIDLLISKSNHVKEEILAEVTLTEA